MGARRDRKNPAVKDAVTKPTVTDEANNIIRGERAKFYGAPWDNIGAIAKGWDAYMKAKSDPTLTAFDVCNLMVILKVMRGAQGYHRDSVVDTVGYAALMEVLEDPEARDAFARDILGLFDTTTLGDA